ncbi:MAG: hypothetical protein Q7V62_07845 [Actinomycetota bacterium]|nr:hypothetical protein [Actinomycetota bacterium]
MSIVIEEEAPASLLGVSPYRGSNTYVKHIVIGQGATLVPTVPRWKLPSAQTMQHVKDAIAYLEAKYPVQHAFETNRAASAVDGLPWFTHHPGTKLSTAHYAFNEKKPVFSGDSFERTPGQKALHAAILNAAMRDTEQAICVPRRYYYPSHARMLQANVP